MRAFTHHRYGGPEVLELRDVEVPAVGDDQVLVRVRAASVNAADWHVMRASPAMVRLSEGFRRPRNGMVGLDAAGVVEQVGKDVTHLQVGDAVFGIRRGAFAEYVAGRHFVAKPENLSFEEAAAVPVAGLTALQALQDKGDIASGQRVLVNGAGGGVGTFTVQIAKALGAEVTATTSGDKLELVASLGAEEVLDHSGEDVTRTGPYDLIVDIGGGRSIGANRRALAPAGTYVLVGADAGSGGPMKRIAEAALRSRVLRQKVEFFVSWASTEHLLRLKELIETGDVRPVIDRTYDFREVPDAIRHLERGGVRGKIAVTVAP